MKKSSWTKFGGVVLAVAVAAPLVARQQFSEVVPTKKDPLRFEAFAVQMERGAAGVIQVTIERWTTDTERAALVALLQKTTDSTSDQKKLLKALQDTKIRTGSINTPNSMAWDLKYAYESKLADGGRQIVIATDKPMGSFTQAASGTTYDAAFTLLEFRFPAGSAKGEGKMLAQAGLSTKSGKLQLEAYTNQPTQLTQVTEINPKVKK
jgi:hypothetical protein